MNTPHNPQPPRKKVWPWVVGAVALLAIIGQCQHSGHSGNTSAPSTTAPTTTAPPPDKHSRIANIALPPEASPNTDHTSSTNEEIWDITASACNTPHGGFFDCVFSHTPSYGEVVAAMDTRLPVNQPLDGMPWCGRSQPGTDEIGEPHENTNWAWGTDTDMVHVSVEKQDIRLKPGFWNTPAGGTFIFITRGPAPQGCKP